MRPLEIAARRGLAHIIEAGGGALPGTLLGGTAGALTWKRKSPEWVQDEYGEWARRDINRVDKQNLLQRVLAGAVAGGALGAGASLGAGAYIRGTRTALERAEAANLANIHLAPLRSLIGKLEKQVVTHQGGGNLPAAARIQQQADMGRAVLEQETRTFADILEGARRARLRSPWGIHRPGRTVMSQQGDHMGTRIAPDPDMTFSGGFDRHVENLRARHQLPPLRDPNPPPAHPDLGTAVDAAEAESGVLFFRRLIEKLMAGQGNAAAQAVTGTT